jgi:hypothetical protein
MNQRTGCGDGGSARTCPAGRHGRIDKHPPVSMEMTGRVTTNVENQEGTLGQMGQFSLTPDRVWE